MRFIAYFFTLTTGIAIRIAKKINISVGVSSNEPKKRGTAIAAVVAEITTLTTTACGMADEKFNKIRGNSEESVHERARHDTAPVLADEPIKAMMVIMAIVPIPVSCIATQNKHNYITAKLHASLRN